MSTNLVHIEVIILAHIYKSIREFEHESCKGFSGYERLSCLLKYAHHADEPVRQRIDYCRIKGRLPDFDSELVHIEEVLQRQLSFRAPDQARISRYYGMMIEMTWKDLFPTKKQTVDQEMEVLLEYIFVPRKR